MYKTYALRNTKNGNYWTNNCLTKYTTRIAEATFLFKRDALAARTSDEEVVEVTMAVKSVKLVNKSKK